MYPKPKEVQILLSVRFCVVVVVVVVVVVFFYVFFPSS